MIQVQIITINKTKLNCLYTQVSIYSAGSPTVHVAIYSLQMTNVQFFTVVPGLLQILILVIPQMVSFPERYILCWLRTFRLETSTLEGIPPDTSLLMIRCRYESSNRRTSYSDLTGYTGYTMAPDGHSLHASWHRQTESNPLHLTCMLKASHFQYNNNKLQLCAIDHHKYWSQTYRSSHQGAGVAVLTRGGGGGSSLSPRTLDNRLSHVFYAVMVTH